MCSAIADDRTTRARILDAAIAVFGRDGFGVGVRTIATAAAVSPGLLNHHFGSKDGLREECDRRVLAIVHGSKTAALSSSPVGLIEQLATVDHYAPIVAYIVRSFAAGGRLATEMFERMVDDTVDYLDEGVATGRIKPSRDPRARARFLTRQSVGGLLLYLQMQPEGADFSAAFHDMAAEITLPALELYTEGLLADDDTLITYLQHRENK
ncbi:TetR/AcrR family transcriptional regulator [Rhodococcoides fascians]|uniref:TetR/AcrR family transcriptional regulator n=1 Tax=Rhodococcoides fascians TaxID=1828 RepID=UPI0005692302|nr:MULTISPECIES: TetR/AcrR family transcriptional regulator [Rhodococcus]OZC74472.1 TetR/AcrR family transcriptional regulator [Rhodococcus sp. 06-418-1B]